MTMSISPSFRIESNFFIHIIIIIILSNVLGTAAKPQNLFKISTARDAMAAADDRILTIMTPEIVLQLVWY
jgi:hypothetical protein